MRFLSGVTLWAVCAVIAQAQATNKTLAEADCTAAKLGSDIPVSAIGLPVSAVTLMPPQWHAEAGGVPAYCSIEGSMAPVDASKTARPIRFGVALPAVWTQRAAQLGVGGMNGSPVCHVKPKARYFAPPVLESGSSLRRMLRKSTCAPWPKKPI